MPDYFKDGWTNILVFGGAYPPEVKDKSSAVNWAVLTGACDRCKHLSVCSTNKRFVPPSDTACMKKKAEFLKEAAN